MADKVINEKGLAVESSRLYGAHMGPARRILGNSERCSPRGSESNGRAESSRGDHPDLAAITSDALAALQDDIAEQYSLADAPTNLRSYRQRRGVIESELAAVATQKADLDRQMQRAFEAVQGHQQFWIPQPTRLGPKRRRLLRQREFTRWADC